MIWSASGINFTIDNITIGSLPAPVGGFYKYGKFSAGTPNPWVNGTAMAPFDQRVGLFSKLLNLFFVIFIFMAISVSFYSESRRWR